MATAVATAKQIPISPRKVRLVAGLIRGRDVASARDILDFTVKKGAEPMRKVLDSAVANAENAASESHDRIDTDTMVVTEVQVNGGRTRKKYQPAPRGSAHRLRLRSCHIAIKISDENQRR